MAVRDPASIRRWRRLVELYASYWRPEVRGFELLPPAGPFLVVGNHSGGATPPDLPILLSAWWRERGISEPVYALFHSFFLSLPGVRAPMARFGALEAGHEAAEHALKDGSIVIVYPGGDHDAFRPWTQRNRIDFAGRTGFVRLAQRTGVPIVPAVTHGVQSGIFVLTRGERMLPLMPHLRAMRLKVSPVVLGPPWLVSFGLPTIPLPTKATVQLGPAIDVGPTDDVDEVYRRVTSAMQATLDDLAHR